MNAKRLFKESGIIQYLIRKDVTWDNILVKIVAVFIMLSVFTGIKEAARRRHIRRRNTEECELLNLDDLTISDDDSLFIKSVPTLSRFQRCCISQSQRRMIVRSFVKKHICYE